MQSRGFGLYRVGDGVASLGVSRGECIIQTKLQSCVGDDLQEGHMHATVQTPEALVLHDALRSLGHAMVHLYPAPASPQLHWLIGFAPSVP